MRRLVSTFAVAMVTILMVVSCGRKDRVIPPSDFASIYADMLLADQWFADEAKTHRYDADTLWVYDPIFEKYGYTKDDYYSSVEYYLRDPMGYSKILKDAMTILSDEAEKIHNELAEDARYKSKTYVRTPFESSYRNYVAPPFYGNLSVVFNPGGEIRVTRVPAPFKFDGPLALDHDIALGSPKESYKKRKPEAVDSTAVMSGDIAATNSQRLKNSDKKLKPSIQRQGNND